MLRLASSLLFRSPESGAESVLYSAMVDNIDQLCGKLVSECQLIDIEPIARNYKDAERLWAMSVDLCGLTNRPITVK